MKKQSLFICVQVLESMNSCFRSLGLNPSTFRTTNRRCLCSTEAQQRIFDFIYGLRKGSVERQLTSCSTSCPSIRPQCEAASHCEAVLQIKSLLPHSVLAFNRLRAAGLLGETPHCIEPPHVSLLTVTVKKGCVH